MRKFIIFIIIFLISVSINAEDKCLDCHQQNPPKGMEVAAEFNSDELAVSVHSDLLCTDCHNIDPAKKHAKELDVDCGSCHPDAKKQYDESPHLKGRTENISNVPDCVTCHGGHETLNHLDPKSKTHHRNLAEICMSCHADESLSQEIRELPKATMIKSYKNSVHGIALEKGIENAPTCTDCHGSHSSKASDNPDSPIYKTHIAETCGKCHTEIAEHYSNSVHGEMLSKGVLESPTCTNCHGEHNIKQHLDPESTVFATNIVKTCSECHTSEIMTAKFGLKADRIETFKESFHGVANEFGETNTANCASCHGVHDIYRQDNPKSWINKNNISSTCGKCHDDLPEDFVQESVHKSPKDKESGGEYYVRNFYYWFITIIILGFIIYRVLEYKRRVKRVE